ncbi:hypothetical protein DPMN_052042 [Dreissena polymorpha]|uniref:Uncharacterized protein n=1 Tax=Dreissena polymorpha TaxID=45954 RepID=A0A9D4CKY8_DREPO|nr:hypothetical protein DPMN_052042 [Dreissena polymorpha]
MALRGNFLVDTFIAEMTQEDPDIRKLLYQAEELYSTLLDGEKTLADATCSEILSNSRWL